MEAEQPRLPEEGAHGGFLGLFGSAASVCPEEVGELPDFVLFSRARHGSSMESGASEDDFPTETLESCNP